MFYVYLLENESGTHYVGFTNNLKRRLREHDAGQSIATKSLRRMLRDYNYRKVTIA